jgi:hypothetical protein
VFPAVAEIVEVFERFAADMLDDIDKSGLGCIERTGAASAIAAARSCLRLN